MHEYSHYESPVGRLCLVSNDEGLAAVTWPIERTGRVDVGSPTSAKDNALLQETARQLDEYFAGDRKSFDLPLAPQGTEFQLQVWNALAAIPYGETRSYKELALAIGNPKAVRAVGAANGRNPISIIVPCHRVIGADQKLTGFAGGLESKRLLLNLEAENSDAGLFSTVN